MLIQTLRLSLLPNPLNSHTMFYILSVGTAFLLGFISGYLVLRNNAAKASSTEAKGKALLDALKGK